MTQLLFHCEKYNILFVTLAIGILVIFCFSFYMNYQFVSNYFLEYPTTPACQCKRAQFYSSNTTGVRLNSTCSDPGTFFEAAQNVVSFSLHLPLPVNPDQKAMYIYGISRNLWRMRKYYPGFSMRIYTDERSTTHSELCKLWCNNADLFWCDVRRSPSLGNIAKKCNTLWRFVPLGDPTVNIFLSRDLDSVITPREVAAVQDWLSSNKPFHVMRDHPEHCLPMLAGTWGARNGLISRNVSEELRDQLLELDEVYKEFDQHILAYVMESRMDDILAHDSYCCEDVELGNFTVVRPFPTRRLNNADDFVGNPSPGKGNWSLPPCPEECRPSNKKDWVYC